MKPSSNKNLVRCSWAGDDDQYIAYHDNEWGVPLRDDQKLFELLILEGAQAGLSWLTVLKRRDGYKKAFKDFDIKMVAKMGETQVEKLMSNQDIIRNRLKIRSTISNAKAILKIQAEFRSFNNYLWQYVGGKPTVHSYSQLSQLPSSDPVAAKLSLDLKNRGLNFVGPTICYAFMQSSGMVNDHLISCFRYKQLISNR